MLVDWFTVAAQALNFLVLVWLLKRFLYQPILHAIDAREARIRAELDAAAATQAKADAEREDFQARTADLQTRRSELLACAASDADAERERLVAAARARADTLAARRQDALERETAQLGESLTRRTGEEVLALSRDVLRSLADTQLEAAMADRFLHRLADLREEDLATFAGALATDDTGLQVRSGIELPPEQRTALLGALRTRFGDGFAICFETDSELVAGIELRTGGQALSWTIAARLDDLRRGIDELVKANNVGSASPSTGSAAPSELLQTGSEIESKPRSGPEAARAPEDPRACPSSGATDRP